MACMDYMDPYVRCLKKAAKLTHSLTHCSAIGRKWTQKSDEAVLMV